ncbi:MAG: hypothetical protein PUD20_00910 [bacterium]|nr:hypothetical protein [bacterium]
MKLRIDKPIELGCGNYNGHKYGLMCMKCANIIQLITVSDSYIASEFSCGDCGKIFQIDFSNAPDLIVKDNHDEMILHPLE